MDDQTLPSTTNQGFSLTEVLVTVSIIGILISISFPSYMSQMRRTQQGNRNDRLTTDVPDRLSLRRIRPQS